jgi:methyltransferase, FkbM family
LESRVSDAPGELTFFEVEGTGLSTLDKHNAARAEAKGYRVKPRRVPVLTLAQVLAENNVPPSFEFLKIDVEGLEQSVLAGNDWQRFRPQVVMIEATVPETPIRRQDGCRALLTGMGWRHAWFDGLNDWYLAPNFEPPNGAFDAPPNVFDHYVTRRTVEAETQLAELRQATEVRDGRICPVGDLPGNPIGGVAAGDRTARRTNSRVGGCRSSAGQRTVSAYKCYCRIGARRESRG